MVLYGVIPTPYISVIIIRLFGHLKKFGGFKLDVRNAAEALRAINTLIGSDKFKQAIDTEYPYEIIVDGGRKIGGNNPADLALLTIEKTLDICPVVGGAGAIGRIILGVVLVGISFFMPAALLGLSSTTIGLFGASLIIGGIMNLLSPQQEQTYNGNNFDASSVNRAIQGQPVPILFGRRYIQPVPISVWVTNNNVDVHYNPLPQ